MAIVLRRSIKKKKNFMHAFREESAMRFLPSHACIAPHRKTSLTFTSSIIIKGHSCYPAFQPAKFVSPLKILRFFNNRRETYRSNPEAAIFREPEKIIPSAERRFLLSFGVATSVGSALYTRAAFRVMATG